MIKINELQKELDNLKKGISYALFDDKVYEDSEVQNGKDLMTRNREYIITILNEIFASHLTLDSKPEDLPWNKPTISQIDKLENLMIELQKKYIIAPDEPCDDCGHYFSPCEDMYITDDGNLCEECWHKEFPTMRTWNEYLIMVNSDEIFEPNALKRFSDDEIDNMAEALCDTNAIAYFTQATM